MGQATSYTEISAADAFAFFKGQGIKVQEATAIKKKGEDGKVRESFDTSNESLKPGHILAAKDYGAKVTITTIDGQRYEAAKSAGKSESK